MVAILSLTLTGSIAIVAVMFLRGGASNIAAFVAGYFLLFAFGPVVNLLVGNQIYFGIPVSAVPKATVGMFLALAGMLVGSRIVRQTRVPGKGPADDGRSYPAVQLLHYLLTAYVLYFFAARSGALQGLSKVSKLTIVGAFHYQYLVVAMLSCCLYFTAVRTWSGRIAYAAQALSYTAYCLITDERDFIFVLFSLLLHIRLTRRTGGIVLPGLAGAALAGLATYLFAARTGGTVDTTQVLNQGSILFVDSYVVNRYPDLLPFLHGETYLNAVLNLLPNSLVAGHQSLADGLVQSYAPDSDSGFGFSLTAEAYMNFGTAGSFGVFALITVVHRVLINRTERSLFFSFASVSFTVAWMYAIRGESLSFLKVCVCGLVLYFGVWVTSLRRNTDERPATRAAMADDDPPPAIESKGFQGAI